MAYADNTAAPRLPLPTPARHPEAGAGRLMPEPGQPMDLHVVRSVGDRPLLARKWIGSCQTLHASATGEPSDEDITSNDSRPIALDGFFPVHMNSMPQPELLHALLALRSLEQGHPLSTTSALTVFWQPLLPGRRPFLHSTSENLFRPRLRKANFPNLLSLVFTGIFSPFPICV